MRAMSIKRSLVIADFPFADVFLVEVDYEGDREEEGAHICDRLGCLNAYAVKRKGEEKYRGKEEDALAAARKERCDCFEAETLVKLVDVCAERHEGNTDAEEIECFRADSDDLGIVAEEPHDLLGK